MRRLMPCSKCRVLSNVTGCEKEEHPDEGWMWWTCPDCGYENTSLLPVNVRYRQDVLVRVEALEVAVRKLQKSIDRHFGARDPHLPGLGASKS